MKNSSKNRHRRLRYETLECRQVLAVTVVSLPEVGVYAVDDAVAIPAELLELSTSTTDHPAIQGSLDGHVHHHPTPDDFDRIVLHDGSFIPLRASHSANSLIVPAGETFTLAADSDYDFIEVHGTLRVSRDFDTTLRFVDLIVFPGGELDMGTESDPVLRNVDFVVKDVPIDLEVDPWQLGNGIINRGTWHAYGRKLDHTWTTLSGDLRAGDTEIVLADEPVGWQVGDELLIPDTAQMSGTVRRESTVRISAIDGNQITLDKPLDFDHLAVRDPSGNVRVMPYVANISRNIVIRSENPAGTRGHTIQLEQSEADVRYVSFLGLGRTLAAPLNNAVSVDGVVTPGTNQVARYAWHWHHVHPSHDAHEEHPHSGHLIGSFFDGSDIGKWGIVIHGTSDMHVADNITDSFTGAGIVTEDGNEYRNVIERNFAMGSFGYGTNHNSKKAMLQNIPGGEGTGFWFHSSENYIRDNVAVNNNMGYVTLNFLHPKGFQPGAVPLEFANNVALSNLRHGIEAWRAPVEFVVRESILANNGSTQFFFGDGEPGSITLRDTLIFAQGGVSTGVHSSLGYARNLKIYGGEILGCAVGTMTVKDGHVISGTVLQNRINFDWRVGRNSSIPMIVIEDVISTGLPGLPLQHFATGEYDPSHRDVRISYTNNSGYRVLLKNWQESGKNYVFYRPHALASNLAVGQLPEQGLTNGELWAKYGMAIDGGPVPTEAVPLADSDGYVLQYSGETPPIDLAVSRWILLTPNGSGVYSPSKMNEFKMVYTGASADVNLLIEIDGQLLKIAKLNQSSLSRTSFPFRGDGIWKSPGEHTVKTWRTLDGEIIDGSEMIFEYFVGDALPI